jgi:hypothetical protein
MVHGRTVNKTAGEVVHQKTNGVGTAESGAPMLDLTKEMRTGTDAKMDSTPRSRTFDHQGKESPPPGSRERLISAEREEETDLSAASAAQDRMEVSSPHAMTKLQPSSESEQTVVSDGEAATTPSPKKAGASSPPNSETASIDQPASMEGTDHTAEAMKERKASVPTEVGVESYSSLEEGQLSDQRPTSSPVSVSGSVFAHILPRSAGTVEATPGWRRTEPTRDGPRLDAAAVHTLPPQVIVTSLPILPQPKGTTRPRQGALRRGKWTVEEEAYVARVIQDFNSGFLDAPAGTTLRTYLSDKLQCDPMRITKKFTGEACIGKRVFHPAVRCIANAAAIDKAQVRLSKCLDSLL